MERSTASQSALCANAVSPNGDNIINAVTKNLPLMVNRFVRQDNVIYFFFT
jgi:hypothetical protein